MSICVVKNDFADAIKMRILRCGDYSGLSGRPNVITEVLLRERLESQSVGEGGVPVKVEDTVI